MEAQNKRAIRNLYENILNPKAFDQLQNVISRDYKSENGEKGINAFQKPLMNLTRAFPDAKWTLNEMIAEGEKVFLSHTLKGTHKAPFRGIFPEETKVTSKGMVVYKLKDGKIIESRILTDQLNFLQQLEVLPRDLSSFTRQNKDNAIFVDQFSVPGNAIDAFNRRMKYNRDFIRKLPGFIRDEVLERKDDRGNWEIMTIAVWENQETLGNAKQRVQEEYDRIGFKPAEFLQELEVTMKRGEFMMQ